MPFLPVLKVVLVHTKLPNVNGEIIRHYDKLTK
jgi:hypothetical protein